jgi:hypothetical protein
MYITNNFFPSFMTITENAKSFGAVIAENNKFSSSVKEKREKSQCAVQKWKFIETIQIEKRALSTFGRV